MLLCILIVSQARVQVVRAPPGQGHEPGDHAHGGAAEVRGVRRCIYIYI